MADAGSNLWLLVIPAALSWFFQVLVRGIASTYSKVSPAYALTAPLNLGLVYVMLIDSSIRFTRGNDVKWKGHKIYETSGVRPLRFRRKKTTAADL